MPRIKKNIFPEVVKDLYSVLGFEFTQEPNKYYKVGDKVWQRDMKGTGYVVGFRKGSSTIIAYFPENKDFYGAAGVCGCYSTSTYLKEPLYA